jgi:hypothetical protein
MARWQAPQDWQDWTEWLAAGLQARSRWRLPLVMLGMLFAGGRRTVSTWLRANGLCDDWQDYYYFLQPVGRKAEALAERLLTLIVLRLTLPERVLLAIDDSPTKRYGPHVQGAGIHHNPTPGPADQKFLYGHIWVTLALVVRHVPWGPIGLPLLGLLYVRAKDVPKIPQRHRWTFRTKLELAVGAIEKFSALLKRAGKRVWAVADGAYAKCPFLRPLVAAGITIVSRLRKDAALHDLPPRVKRRGRGRPRKYGAGRISLAKRAGQKRGWQTIECLIYGQRTTKTIKTFLATYHPVGGVIRVVIVKELNGCQFFFCTDPDATAREIVETFAERAVIEQNFHDAKEVWGAGQQQVRNIWTNIAAFNLNLWMHTLVELWCWDREHAALVDRSRSPWDDDARRPSHADRRKTLRHACLQHEFSRFALGRLIPRKLRALIDRLVQLTP